MPEYIRSEAGSFEEKKQQYFTRLALSMREALTMHKVGRLWEKNKEGKKDWHNVSEHCLVETVRAQTLAELLQLPSDIRNDIMVAATLHDFDKRQEIEAMREAEGKGESPLGASQKNEVEGAEFLHESGFSSRIIRFAEGTGAAHPEQIRTVESILHQEKLHDDDIAHLVLHYIDNYTRGSEWAEPVIQDASGKMINEVDRRIAKNRANPAYVVVAKEQTEDLAVDHVQGKTVFDIMSDVSHLIEERLTAIIRERTGVSIEPLQLPEEIDARIRKKIETL